MSKRPFVLFGLFAAICLIGLPILAAGRETSPDTGAVQIASRDADERDMFQNNCGSCHTLADAGTAGTIGPNLDESQPSLELAVDRVTNGAGVMPSFADQLSEQQIQDVAAYVSTATRG